MEAIPLTKLGPLLRQNFSTLVKLQRACRSPALTRGGREREMINIFSETHHRPYSESDFVVKSSSITSISAFSLSRRHCTAWAPRRDGVGAENY